MSSTTLHTAQVAAITGSAFLAGGILSLSGLALPTLALPSTASTATNTAKPTPGTPTTHLTRQWLYLYDIGSAIAPKMALVISTTFAYLGYTVRPSSTAAASTSLLRSQPSSTTSNLYYVAAVLTVGIAPFTLGVMWPTNTKLKEYAEKEEGGESKEEGEEVLEAVEVQGLLKKWSNLNAVRGAMPLAGAVVGAIAALV